MAFYNFTLVLLDENDNAPRFESPPSSAACTLSLYENNALGEAIHHFVARDADLGPNGRVTYSLESADSSAPSLDSLLHIEPSSGLLSARRVFDRETRDEYAFYVRARDNPEPLGTTGNSSSRSLSTRIRCVLRVLDVNDNAPVIAVVKGGDNEENARQLAAYVDGEQRAEPGKLSLRFDENLPVATRIAR